LDLTKLFQTQKVLRDRIGYEEQDRFNKLTLALLVELGECANEWRGFKFWSVNQFPHTSAVRVPCMMEEDKEYYNPLLEEYVDKLHFILELGIEINFDFEMWQLEAYKYKNITLQFIYLTQKITDFWEAQRMVDYVDVFCLFVGLGELLGFTWEEIEEAYYTKNQINHKRQEVGY
jgi:dimeric dUTPase (all-alpha-NTP-PPase superfamily)